MKIGFLMITNGIVNRGGEVGTQMLAQDLKKLGHDVTYIQGGQKGEGYKIKQIKLPFNPVVAPPTTVVGKIIDRLHLGKKELMILYFSLITIPILLTEKFEILFPVDGFWQVLVCKVVSMFTGSKILFSGKSGGWVDKHALWLKPDVFVPITSPAADWARKLFPDQKIKFIPEQLDTRLFRPDVKPIKTSLNHPIVLVIAAFTRYKRVDAVIRAVARLKKTSLLVVGAGEDEEKLRGLAKKLLPGRYKFMKSEYGNLPKVYAVADVFTLVSETQEAFGRVLIEALASGLPVVTTDDPLRRSIVGEVGIFVDPSDQKEYVKALKRAIENPLPKRVYREQGKKYDRNITALAYEKVMKSLLE